MTDNNRHRSLRGAMAEVRDCAAQIETQAESLLHALPEVPMDEGLRTAALALGAGLKDTAARVTFELALLQAQLNEATVDAATVVRTLSSMDATMMDALAGIPDVADRLETAAEHDEKNERAFVLVIEAAGVMLQGLEKARAATQALRVA